MTVSTVALGSVADQALMAQIAEIGRGRYYETMEPLMVPQIFTRETMHASRLAIKEDLFSAVQVGDHPMLAGYRNAELPFTLGYVMTLARPTSQVLLTTDTGDPLGNRLRIVQHDWPYPAEYTLSERRDPASSPCPPSCPARSARTYPR